jgi:GT2 family glycosyltransferase
MYSDKIITPHNPLQGNKAELNIPLRDSTDAQVSIVIVHKDSPAHLNILLQSITVTSFNNNYEIIVVDNGSGAESQQFLDQLEGEIKIIRNEKNLFFSAAANKGAAAADPNSKYIVFMHHDAVIIHPGWLDLMVQIAEGRESGLVGTEMAEYIIAGQQVSYLQEWCLLASRECWNMAGPFPEELPQVGGAFIFTFRAQKLGFKPQIIGSQIVHHYRIFALDVNMYEKLIETAMSEIPKLITDIQSRPLKGN